MTLCKHDLTPHSNDELMQAAKTLCEQAGRRFTPLREHVFALIINSTSAVKAYELLERLEPKLGSQKPPTVYRTLDFLSELGLIHRVEAINAYIACDHTDGGHVAEFFICENCDSLQERHANDHIECIPDGFQIRRSVIEHYGLCKNCAS